MLRRTLLRAAPFLPLAATAAAQESWSPNRPVTLLCGFAPGGGADIIARILATALQEDFGQPVAVENRVGAGGTIAGAAVARARPDGLTMVMGTFSTQVVTPLLMQPAPYDTLRDMTAIGLTGNVAQVVVVPASSPAKTLQEFLAMVRADPGKYSYASSGNGSSQHLAAEMLCRAAGVKMVHVPYRGSSQAATDLVAGRVDVNVDTLPTNLPFIRGGQLRALAVTLGQRLDSLPEVPTVAESGFPGFDIGVWYMLAGPAGLPAPVQARWDGAVRKALANPQVKARLVEAGYLPGQGGMAEATALVQADLARFRPLIADLGVKIE